MFRRDLEEGLISQKAAARNLWGEAMISPAAHIASLSPYALAQLNAPAGKRLISLSQNESLRLPNPRAIEAGAKARDGRASLSRSGLGVNCARRCLVCTASLPKVILCGNGSMELIACLAQAFADEQNAVLAPAHAYPFFRSAAQMARARYRRGP